MNENKYFKKQTVYVPTKDGSLIEVCSRDGMSSENVVEIKNSYVFTKEEVEMLLRNTWAISRAYFYEEEFGITPNKFPDIDNYIKNILCG